MRKFTLRCKQIYLMKLQFMENVVLYGNCLHLGAQFPIDLNIGTNPWLYIGIAICWHFLVNLWYLCAIESNFSIKPYKVDFLRILLSNLSSLFSVCGMSRLLILSMWYLHPQLNSFCIILSNWPSLDFMSSSFQVEFFLLNQWHSSGNKKIPLMSWNKNKIPPHWIPFTYKDDEHEP